ncbi:MAG: pyruvate dehydrogenase (acetyl-transferring) E1 component subunit alpha [Acidiferrobacteraceae bacterium]|nr:pyruvate dehydrogenase (acetyl-transferring) E1 component subunit alpha [Acidiferrobacteraceae bacterium]MBF40604.1 pyruvate dehydrogenase (acetyl-transferring) E1 component subunit alpha [Acidiferrobacteraceae bacterium]|tara:strand:+ start:889 stop:1869 length:981 start_codon:yes stop_codon:yes gene_type:complete
MSLTQEKCLKMYTDMWRIRLFEEEANRQTNLGNVVGTLHMYCGEEAVAVGVCANLRDDDYVLGTHRSHGHCLAKGAESDKMMAELFGKATGTCGGKGGSMHVADFSLNMLGANGIVGAGIGPTTGTALASKIRGTDQVSVCFFGDGAAARGTFHEAIAMGSLWQLPVVYVCENNGYQQWVPRKNVAVVDSVADMAVSYSIPGVSVNGQDAIEVYEVIAEAVARARSGGGPSLIEARTYRFYGHSLGDEQQYRTEEEVEERKRNADPINILRDFMTERDWLSSADDEQVQQRAGDEITRAAKFAEESPWPEMGEVGTDVLFDAKEVA